MGRNEHRIARNHHNLPFFGVIAIVGVVNYVRMTVDAGYGLFVQRFLIVPSDILEHIFIPSRNCFEIKT